MEIDRNGLEVLDDDACFALLASARFGRVALTMDALPVILPVQFAMLGQDPVFRTNTGTKLDAAVRNQVVCLEADHNDVTYHEGWSVLVTGRASVIVDPDELAEAEDLPLRPWTPHIGEDFVRIRSALVSGRRIRLDVPAGAPT